MKVELVTEESELEFTPFEIKISVESEEEARELWHRFNYTPKKEETVIYFKGYVQKEFNINSLENGDDTVRDIIRHQGVKP